VPTQVGVQATPSGDGRLRVVVTSAPGRTLTAIGFEADARVAGNALVDTATRTAQAPPFVVNLPPGTTTYTLHVRRATAGQATTVALHVRDSCDALWPSLVGGGPGAF
jgi:hypothetical protein